MYSSSGRPMAVSQKVDLIEQNQCDIWTQNTKISLKPGSHDPFFPSVCRPSKHSWRHISPFGARHF